MAHMQRFMEEIEQQPSSIRVPGFLTIKQPGVLTADPRFLESGVAGLRGLGGSLDGAGDILNPAQIGHDPLRVEHASRFSNGKNEIAIQMIGSIIMLAATNATGAFAESQT